MRVVADHSFSSSWCRSSMVVMGRLQCCIMGAVEPVFGPLGLAQSSGAETRARKRQLALQITQIWMVGDDRRCQPVWARATPDGTSPSVLSDCGTGEAIQRPAPTYRLGTHVKSVERCRVGHRAQHMTKVRRCHESQTEGSSRSEQNPGSRPHQQTQALHWVWTLTLQLDHFHHVTSQSDL